ncbi:MAG TPA: pirin family protein [Rhodanobacteraceae bacterium]|nr:pirin family protein [Rhodanobacteraceae bacterium]
MEKLRDMLLLSGREHDLGGFHVRRLLPQLSCRSVGPFVFFDHMGPARFAAGAGVDVRPHPHIGLATVTWLFEGVMRHRDTLGSVLDIRPGAVNWMTAGRGIAHSERTPPEARVEGAPLHGIQTWVALPLADQEVEPSFHHFGAETLPSIEGEGVRLTVVAGNADGRRAPVPVFSPTLYLAGSLREGARFELDDEHEQRAVYIVEGAADVGGTRVDSHVLAVLPPAGSATITALADTRAVIVGGAALDAPRHLWWNFVSSSRERIEQAKRDWVEGRFGLIPGDDEEFIPLPEK